MGGSSSATRPGVSRFPARWQWVSLALGTGSSCEPDEARGSPRREAYSLYVERRGRPSNEVWRRKLPQYRLDGARGPETLHPGPGHPEEQREDLLRVLAQERRRRGGGAG